MAHCYRNRFAALALSLLAIGPVHAGLTDVSGTAGVFDKVLTIQPIAVCSVLQNTCGSTASMYQDFAIQTYAKYGLALAFLPTKTITDNARAYGTGIDQYLVPGLGQSTNVKTLNAWLQPEIVMADGSTAPWGAAYVDWNGLAINSSLVLKDGRRDTFSHEVGHALGLDHATDGDLYNLMRIGADRKSPTGVLDAAQQAYMRNGFMISDAPKLSLSHTITHGGASVEFSLTVDSLPEAVGLRRFSIDLPDLNLVDRHQNQGPRPWEYFLDLRTSMGNDPLGDYPGDRGVLLDGGASFAGLAGLPMCSRDTSPELDFNVCYGENTAVYFPSGSPDYDLSPGYLTTNGEPEIVFDFSGPLGKQLKVGDRLNFSINLSEHHLSEETTYLIDFERDLSNTLLQFEYDYGLTGQVLLDASGVTDSRRFVAIGDSTADPTPFGAQFAPGEVRVLPPGAIVETGERPNATSNGAPEPSGLMLAATALLLLARRRRNPR